MAESDVASVEECLRAFFDATGRAFRAQDPKLVTDYCDVPWLVLRPGGPQLSALPRSSTRVGSYWRACPLTATTACVTT